LGLIAGVVVGGLLVLAVAWFHGRASSRTKSNRRAAHFSGSSS
jgi:hypothetical protein